MQFFDDFNRDENPLSTGWTGVGDPGGLECTAASGHAFSSQASGTFAGSGTTAAYGLPAEVYCDMPVKLAVSSGRGLYLELLDSFPPAAYNGYYVKIGGDGSYFVAKNTNGGYLGNLFSGSLTLANGDSFRLSTSAAGLISFYQKPSGGSWTLVGEATDTDHAGPFHLCVETNDNVVEIDNFGGGTVGSTVDGAATLDASLSMVASADVVHSGSASLTVDATLTAEGGFTRPGRAVMSASLLLIARPDVEAPHGPAWFGPGWVVIKQTQPTPPTPPTPTAPSAKLEGTATYGIGSVSIGPPTRNV